MVLITLIDSIHFSIGVSTAVTSKLVTEHVS